MQQDAFRREPVAARTARLLLVVIHGLRHCGVNDKTHIGPVDSHAEGHRRDDDIKPLGREVFLHASTNRGRQSCVIRLRVEALLAELSRNAFSVLPRDAVDDRAFTRMTGEGRGNLFGQLLPLLDAVDEVRPIEPANENRRILEPELLHDVSANPRRRGGGEGVNARPGK